MSIRLELDDNPEVIQRLHQTILMGKYLCGKKISRSTMKKMVTGVWNLRGQIMVETPYEEEVPEANIFAFEFSDSEDCERVLKFSPWMVANNLLNIKKWELGKKLEEKSLKKCPFWIQVRGLPAQKRSEHNAKQIACSIGELLETEGTNPGIEGVRPYFRIKVIIDTEHPLPRGFWLDNRVDPATWINFRYERLGNICYRCGRLGHTESACKHLTKEQSSESEYKSDLRAEPKQRESQQDSYRNRHEGKWGSNVQWKKLEAAMAERMKDVVEQEDERVETRQGTDENILSEDVITAGDRLERGRESRKDT